MTHVISVVRFFLLNTPPAENLFGNQVPLFFIDDDFFQNSNIVVQSPTNGLIIKLLAPLKNEEIIERISDLENELETNIDVIQEIENQYTFAKNSGHTNSAIKALELLSRIRGANSDKNIDISKEGLEAAIIESLKILGKEKVDEIIKKCEFA